MTPERLKEIKDKACATELQSEFYANSLKLALRECVFEIERLTRELAEARKDGEQAARSYQNIGEEMFKVEAENAKLREALADCIALLKHQDIGTGAGGTMARAEAVLGAKEPLATHSGTRLRLGRVPKDSDGLE